MYILIQRGTDQAVYRTRKMIIEKIKTWCLDAYFVEKKYGYFESIDSTYKISVVSGLNPAKYEGLRPDFYYVEFDEIANILCNPWNIRFMFFSNIMDQITNMLSEIQKARKEKEKEKTMLAEKIGTPAMLEQTAEECVEFAHACMKLARHMRGENTVYTPESEMYQNLAEEMADVIICMDELMGCDLVSYESVNCAIHYKLERMKKRLEEE